MPHTDPGIAYPWAMPASVIEFEQTPNPNALKCLIDRTICEERLSYFSREAAAEHPVARALFDIEGVTNVMLLGDRLTVGKREDVSWRTLKPKIQRALESAS